jgi:hypothetical protein
MSTIIVIIIITTITIIAIIIMSIIIGIIIGIIIINIYITDLDAFFQHYFFGTEWYHPLWSASTFRPICNPSVLPWRQMQGPWGSYLWYCSVGTWDQNSSEIVRLQRCKQEVSLYLFFLHYIHAVNIEEMLLLTHPCISWLVDTCLASLDRNSCRICDDETFF